jgi:hypothetical protein
MLLQLLSTAGEIPANALSLLGNERVMKALVHKLESVQDIRFCSGGEIYRVKLIQVGGKRNERTIRLYKKGLPVLDGLYPGLLNWYLETFRGHSFTGDPFHVWRNHRVAEALAICMAADVETRPYALPVLQKAGITKTVPDSPSFYIARDFKKTDADEDKKTMYTRLIGALFYPGAGGLPGGCYAAYNTRGAVMKWSGRGEVKTAGNLLELVRMNAGIGKVSAALLFGHSPEIALQTILESDKSRKPELRFDKIYPRMHFVPLDANGVRLLKILVSPNWDEKLIGALFEPAERSYNRGHMEYDAIVDGRMILSHLDGDLARLIRFREALYSRTEPADVLCFTWQTGFLKSYLGALAGFRELEMDAVESALRA